MKIIQGLPPEVKPGTPVAFDIEMFGQNKDRLHRPHGEFACISVAIGEKVYMVTDVGKLQKLFDNISWGKLIAHNALYDIRQLSRWVAFHVVPIWDTMLVDQNLWGGYYGGFGLDDLAYRYLGILMNKDVRKNFPKATRMTDEMIKYAADDAYITLQIYKEQEKHIRKEKIDLRSYFEVDAPMIWTVLNMRPIGIDWDKWAGMGNTSLRLADTIARKFPDMNVGSNQQVKSHLQKLAGKSMRIVSTGEELLEEYLDKAQHRGNDEMASFIKSVLSFRKLMKDGNTYGENWRPFLEDGFIYPAWRISEAITGRMSCRDPNMTNVPAKDVRRECFIPPEGYLMGVADVIQQEPRVLGKLSQDKTLLKYIYDKISVHVAVTREVFHNPNLTKKDSEYRTGKAISLGLGYGLSDFGLARELGIPKGEAGEYIALYFQKFSGVKRYIDSYRQIAYKRGYVETPLGRRTHINPYRWNWKNVAINAPVQGGAADQTKLACNNYYSICKKDGLYFGLSLIVHDETVWYFPKEQEHEQKEAMQLAWKQAGETTIGEIPIALELYTGENWSIK